METVGGVLNPPKKVLPKESEVALKSYHFACSPQNLLSLESGFMTNAKPGKDVHAEGQTRELCTFYSVLL